MEILEDRERFRLCRDKFIGAWCNFKKGCGFMKQKLSFSALAVALSCAVPSFAGPGLADGAAKFIGNITQSNSVGSDFTALWNQATAENGTRLRPKTAVSGVPSKVLVAVTTGVPAMLPITGQSRTGVTSSSTLWCGAPSIRTGSMALAQTKRRRRLPPGSMRSRNITPISK